MLDQILNSCTVDGNVIKLPEGQLDRKVYMDVKKALEGIGGKWQGGKVSGFVFPSDPSDRLNEIRGGKKVNLKKDFQFFATPAHIAERLVDLAELENLTSTDALLEPSAGKGDILQAVLNKRKNYFQLGACELMPENQHMIKARFWEVHGFEFICPDFFDINKHYPEGQFARIIANPPFTKNQDIDHVRHMWNQLAPGGIMVSVMSQHWYHGTKKKEWEFNDFVEMQKGEIILLDSGEFKESGTMVNSLIVKLRKESDRG